MVVAVLALIVAMGGAAYALKANSVNSRTIKDGQVKLKDMNKQAKTGWAFIGGGDGGTKINASKGVQVQDLGEGILFVKFPYSVRKRAILTGVDASSNDHYVEVDRCGGANGDIGSCSPDQNDNPRTLFVRTFQGNGAPQDTEFWIAAVPG
jgi:hypothetical protein